MNELLTPEHYFFEKDEEYPMASYDGTPEFELFNRDAYNVDNEQELPQITIMSSISPSELPP